MPEADEAVVADLGVVGVDVQRDAGAVAGRQVGKTLDEMTADMGAFWRYVTGDSQLRWLGPDKGVMHLATGAVVNAVWDLWGKVEGKPVWQLVADMSVEEILSLLDFRYLTNALTREEAGNILEAARAGAAGRRETLAAKGYPTYTTSAGWLGYSDEKLQRLCADAVARATPFRVSSAIWPS